MTEAEELELLELEEEEARAVKLAGGPAPRPNPTTGEAMGRAAIQGSTMGFGDEINAAMQALAEGAPTSMGPLSALQALAEATSGVPEAQRRGGAAVDAERLASMTPGERLKRGVEQFRLNRDADRAGNKAAKEAHPWAYGVTDFVTGIPAAFAMPGGQARTVGALAKAGGLSGLLSGAGGSEADLTQGDVGGFLKDTALGGAVGAGLGAGAGLLGKLVGRAGAGIRSALADAAEMANRTAQKALRTARSSLGGETAAAFQAIAKAEEIAQNAGQRYTAQQAAEAAQWLASPEVKAIAQNAADNLLAAGPERLAGSMQTARNVFEQAKQAATPEAVEQAADALVANPLKNQLLPRLKNYASRAIPPTVGAAAGGLPGAVLGFGAGAVMGNPGTALANMLKHPGTRKLGWELLQKLGLAGSSPITTATERAIVQDVENQ